MLKFTTVQLVDNEDMKGMNLVIRQTKILQCCELYANIERNKVPTPKPELVSLFIIIQCNPRHFSFIPTRTNIFEPNTSYFT